MLKRILFASVLCFWRLSAQNAAGIVVNPVFLGLNNNGQPIAGGKLCSYAAGTSTPQALWQNAAGTISASNPVVLDSAGRAVIYGEGNYKLELHQSGDSNCPGTGSVVWTADNVFIQTSAPTFTSVTAGIFNCTATGSSTCMQQYLGTWSITGAGAFAGQTFVATSTFNSLATGTTSAFQTSYGTYKVTGNGVVADQETFQNQIRLQGYAGPPSANGCSACDAPASGSGLLYYNSSNGTVGINLGNSGWTTLLSTVPGSSNQVIYNNGGSLGASSTMTFSGDILTLGGAPTTGVIAPLLNGNVSGHSGDCPGGNGCTFKNSDGSFTVDYTGKAAAQNVAANHFGTNTSSNTDVSGTITLSAGTYRLSWPSGHTYTSNPVCIGNEYTSASHAISLQADTTGITFSGSVSSSDTIQYVCMFGAY